MELPTYTLLVDGEELLVDAIALVDEPAIMRDFMAFNKQKKVQKFAVQDEEKRIIAAPCMIANMEIYRRDEVTGEEFNVKFPPESIETICKAWAKKSFNNNINLMHDPNAPADGCYVFQSFIINSEMGINTPKGFDEMEDGSWFVFLHVENDAIWQQVKDGTFKGVSVEGKFEQALLMAKQNQVSDEDIILGILENL